MNDWTGLLGSLLYQSEGDALDFKQRQYKFPGGTEDEQSELLKDILAFANSWRRSDAYILIGVKEGEGGKAEVLGETEHPDDSRLQQFVNSKTNRPINFHYSKIDYEGVVVGVIHVPIQSRPFFSKKDFGKVKMGTVYIRRGSSTAIADPDEVAKMGAANSQSKPNEKPELEVFLATGMHQETHTKEKMVCTKLVSVQNYRDIPDYSPPRVQVGGVYLPVMAFGGSVNAQYYKEFAKYYVHSLSTFPCKLVVKNVGGAAARDVRLIVEMSYLDGNVHIVSNRKIPQKPEKEREFSPLVRHINNTPKPSNIEIKKLGDRWRIILQLGKIQPKAESEDLDHFLILPTESSKITLNCAIYSDELPEPITDQLYIQCNVDHLELSVEQLKLLADQS